MTDGLVRNVSVANQQEDTVRTMVSSALTPVRTVSINMTKDQGMLIRAGRQEGKGPLSSVGGNVHIHHYGK